MTRVRFYLDENRMDRALVTACAALGLECTTVAAAGLLRRSDDEQLRFAASQGLTLVTENARDFLRLHAALVRASEEHGGIVIIHQRYHMSVGEQARALAALAGQRSAEDMTNRVEFLRGWLGQG